MYAGNVPIFMKDNKYNSVGKLPKQRQEGFVTIGKATSSIPGVFSLYQMGDEWLHVQISCYNQ